MEVERKLSVNRRNGLIQVKHIISLLYFTVFTMFTGDSHRLMGQVLKSTTISTVLTVLSSRLLSLHQVSRCSRKLEHIHPHTGGFCCVLRCQHNSLTSFCALRFPPTVRKTNYELQIHLLVSPSVSVFPSTLHRR